jgi:hypothetical protein
VPTKRLVLVERQNCRAVNKLAILSRSRCNSGDAGTSDKRRREEICNTQIYAAPSA